MRIAVIGAGFTGLSASYTLTKQGHEVLLFEKDAYPGGLALGFKEKEWTWSLEKYYHHWFTNDYHVLTLAKELQYPVIIKRPKTSMYIDNGIHQLDSIFSLLSFSPLTLSQRIRMGIVLGFLRFNPFWYPLEKINAADFLEKSLGKSAYEKVWKPQLIHKFGNYTNDISLAWFWARIKKRTPSLAYPQGGFLQFAQKLDQKSNDMGSKTLYNISISKIESIGSKISVGKEHGLFDKVIVTLPSFSFLKLCPELPSTYQEKLMRLKGLGAITLVLRMQKKLLTDNTYWLSMCDPKSPFMAIIEHTNFMNSKYYNNEHIAYLGNYLQINHPYFSMNSQQLLANFDPMLRKINKLYRQSLIDLAVFKVPFAQPIIPTNYSKIIPSFRTPIQNLYLANIQQVYPWDRGTNYAVMLGEKVARLVHNDRT